MFTGITAAPSRKGTIETVENVADLEKLRGEWDELLQASASNSFFLTWEWLYPWWKHLSGDRKLCLVTLRSGGELIAIAPLAARPRRLVGGLAGRSLEFVGADRVCSDYLDLIIRWGKETEAVEALGEYLGREMLTLEMANLRRTSCLAAALAVELEQRGWSPREQTIGVCPFIPLAGHSWESYLATLGPEHRYNFRRRLKNVTNASQLRFEQARSPAEAQAALAGLVALHNMRWQGRGGGSDAFNRSDLIAFHEEVCRFALDRGWLRLFLMTMNGRPVASLYGFLYNRTFYFVQSGFDPAYGKHSVGLLAMGLAIKSALEEGAEEYDMLRGEEPYKFHWARETRDLGRLDLYPPRLSARLDLHTQSMRRAARTVVRRVLPKTMAERIAIARRAGVWASLTQARGRSASENA